MTEEGDDDEGEEEDVFSTCRRRRLESAGAVPLKNSSEKCHEHLTQSKGARHYGCDDGGGT